MRDQAIEGRWVLWHETHEWWRLPEHGGSYAYKKTPMGTTDHSDGIPDRRRRLINQDQVDDLLKIAKPAGWQEVLHFPGDIVGIVKTVGGAELELIWWEL